MQALSNETLAHSATRTPGRLCRRQSRTTGIPNRVSTGVLLQILVLFLICLMPGCQYPNSAAMSGTWTFTLTSANSPVLIVTASLTQSGSQISGPVTLNSGNSACGTQGTISGNIQGTSLTLQIVQFQSQAFLNGTTNQAFTSANGTYTTGGAGNCFGSGTFGSWSAFFQ